MVQRGSNDESAARAGNQRVACLQSASGPGFAEKINQPLPGVALAKQPLAVPHAKGGGKAGTHALIDVIRGLTAES